MKLDEILVNKQDILDVFYESLERNTNDTLTALIESALTTNLEYDKLVDIVSCDLKMKLGQQVESREIISYYF